MYKTEIMNIDWHCSVTRFLNDQFDHSAGACKSAPDTEPTLYGTCYALLGLSYLGHKPSFLEACLNFVTSRQDFSSGLMIGPELETYEAPQESMHDREHLLWHSTCTAIPALQHFGIPVPFLLTAAYQFCDVEHLAAWMDRRDLSNAWFEGNNILFVGQMLVYLRDVEQHPGAQMALNAWFDWLDHHADPATSLWGTNGFCGPADAVYGGYHQLLVYWHEGRKPANLPGLVDTVLKLQHIDGGFNPDGNAGACEDVDSVDILVNCYKRLDYRRAEIRFALWRCVDHILNTQNPDGGFPYNRNRPQSHMGIPETSAPSNTSCTFPTWFRIHTLALSAEIIPEHPAFQGVAFAFTNNLSMGWHQSPEGWKLDVSRKQLRSERTLIALWKFRESYRRARRTAGRVKRGLLGK